MHSGVCHRLFGELECRSTFRTPTDSPESAAATAETELALALLLESRNESSFFQPFIRMLPFPMCPAFFTDTEASACRPHPQQSRSLAASVPIFHTSISTHTQTQTHAQLDAFEHEWLRKNRAIVHETSMNLFDAFCELYPHLMSPTLRGDFLVADSTVAQRAFRWHGSELVITPFLDLVNHHTHSKRISINSLSDVASRPKEELQVHSCRPDFARLQSYRRVAAGRW